MKRHHLHVQSGFVIQCAMLSSLVFILFIILDHVMKAGTTMATL